jgi:hypothetical protein
MWGISPRHDVQQGPCKEDYNNLRPVINNNNNDNKECEEYIRNHIVGEGPCKGDIYYLFIFIKYVLLFVRLNYCILLCRAPPLQHDGGDIPHNFFVIMIIIDRP